MPSGVNRAKFTGDITYHPFTPGASGAWVVPLEGISVNGNAVDIRADSNNVTSATNGTATGAATPSGSAATPSGSAATSAGSTGINATVQVGIPILTVFPQQVIKRILNNIPNAVQVGTGSQPVVPCDAAANLDIRLTIGGKEYPINAYDVIGPPVQNTSSINNASEASSIKYCQFYIAPDKYAP